MEQDGKNWP